MFLACLLQLYLYPSSHTLIKLLCLISTMTIAATLPYPTHNGPQQSTLVPTVVPSDQLTYKTSS